LPVDKSYIIGIAFIYILRYSLSSIILVMVQKLNNINRGQYARSKRIYKMRNNTSGTMGDYMPSLFFIKE
jgi:hypothetical protein